MRTTLTALFVLAFAYGAFAKINVHNFKSFLAAKGDNTLPTQYYELPIDHFTANAGTFKNRWWFNDTHYQPGGPVIIQDVGEEDAEPFITFLQEGPGVQTAVMQLAQKYNGIGVVWEHRYFGESVPFVQDGKASSVSSLTGDQWSYHTFEQALEDVVFFANNFTLPSNSTAASMLKSPDALHASKTPFLFLGGSYPGVRAATLRTRNPETIFASWASSAPVQASVNMASYYRAVGRALPTNCTTDFAAAINFYDSAVSSNNATLESAIKNGVVSAATDSKVTFAATDALDDASAGEYMLAPWSVFQNGGPDAVQPFCDYFETAGRQLQPSSAGLTSQVTQEQLFGSLLLTLQAEAKADAAGSTNGQLVSMPSARINAPDSSTSQIPADSLSWMWLFCSEFGYFQVADAGSSTSIVTSFETVDQIQSECNSAFPGMLPSAPQVDNVLKFGGWTQNPSRVMYTNGELDPWRTLSVASVEDGAPKRTATTTIPSADGTPDKNSYYGAVYPGQVHAVDFFSSTGQSADRNKAFQTGFTMFTAALDKWMGSFKQGNDPILTSATGSPTSTASKGKPTNAGVSITARNGVIAGMSLIVLGSLW